MPRRRLVLAALMLAAVPAYADESDSLRLVCRATNPALLAEPLAFSIDLAAGRAEETGSGERYGVTAYRDGLGLWEEQSGPGQVVFRIDRVTGRFARVDKQIRLDGVCEKVDRKF